MTATKLLIVHWNQPASCLATVRAFLEQDVPLQITVIDNHSEPDAFAELRQNLSPGIKLVRLEENLGWGGALNVLLRRWLDDEEQPCCAISAHDAVPEKHCLRRLLGAMETDARIGIACPQYAEPYVVRLTRLRGVVPAPAEPQPAGTVQEVDAPHGTLLIVRRECLREIGLFDERYFAYGDEHELGARAVHRGWKVAMVWGAVVTNPGTWTPSTLRSYLFARNSLLLVHDYFGTPAAWLRALLLIVNSLRLRLTSPNDNSFSLGARLRAVRDYFAGRFGPPERR